MKNYKTLLFDLDDTLINNSESMKYAFLKVLEVLKINYSDKLFEMWERFDFEYYNIWEKKQIILLDSKIQDRNTFLRANRFIVFFEELELTIEEAVLLNNLYCNNLGKNILEIDNSSKVIKELRKTHQIVITTNGPHKAAIEKVKKIDIYPHITHIITSDEAGFNKPSAQFFEYAISKIENKDKRTMLLIGDGLNTDIIGGMNNGIDTCWFNPKELELPSEYSPTFIVKKLEHVKKLIK